MKSLFIISSILLSYSVYAQNLGIGTTTPVEKLDVNGNIKVNGLMINSGGSPYDFLKKNNASGQVAFRKGHGGMGLHYIICVQGTTPNPAVTADGPYLSEIKIFAGNFAPTGWMFCEGQILLISQYPSLHTLLGITYGGNGTTNFGLPDLRGAVPVGPGTHPAGYSWTLGQKSD